MTIKIKSDYLLLQVKTEVITYQGSSDFVKIKGRIITSKDRSDYL